MRKLLFSVILLLAVILSCTKSKDETERIEKLGKQAADEFCDCFKNNSKDHCLDKLTSDYKRADYMDDKFIEAFNKQSSCGVDLVIIYSKINNVEAF